MRQKKDNPQDVVTKGYLEVRLDKLQRDIDEKFPQYRDEILNGLDKIMGELEQIREDHVFIHHDLKDHEERITKLEVSKN